jgi:hypothetical protein
MKPWLFNVKFLVVLTVVHTFVLTDSAIAGADLAIDDISISNRPENNIYHPGDSFTVGGTIMNIGDETSESYTAHFYAGDYLIGSLSDNGLEAGSYGGFGTGCTLPDDMPYGTYAISVEISCSNDINPDNNSASDPEDIIVAEEEPPAPPDLRLENVHVWDQRDPYYPGDSLIVDCTVRNIGELTSDTYTIDVYAGDYYIGSGSKDGLVPDDVEGSWINCSLPDEIPEGYHTIRAELSCSNDSNPGNNSDSGRAIRVAMKEPTSVEIRSVDAYGDIFLPGDSIEVQLVAEGIGGQLENSFDTDVYVSTDLNIATGDYKIDSCGSQMIGPGESLTLIEECQLPTDIPAGDYYVGVIVTYPTEDGTETTQGIDSGAVYIGGYSDVVARSVEISPGGYMPGEDITVYSLVENAGPWGTGGYTVDYYASADAVITADDHYIGSVNRDGLLPGQQHSYETVFQTPFNIAAGNYYIGAIITCPTGSDFAENSGCSEETIELVHPAGYVCGQMLYQTREWSQELPIRYALVEVYDADDNDDPLDDRLIGKTHTDSNGNYAVTVLNDETSRQDIYVKVFSESVIGAYPETTNKAGIVKDDVFEETYYLQSDLYRHPQQASAVICMTASDDGGEFMVYESVIEGFHKAKTFFDMNMPEITTYWPCEDEASYFDPCDHSMYISQGDRGDRDVIMHEYGHYIADVFAFAQGDVGDNSVHFWDADLRHNPVQRKDQQARNLAFREAWATLFSVATQYGDTSYRYSGDTRYQDWDEENDRTLEVDLEEDTYDHRQPGEFFENMNCCALWDIFDDKNDRFDDEDTLSDTSLSKIWAVFRNSQPDDIINFWNGWFQNFDYADEITRIFQDHGMSFDKPNIPVSTPTSDSPPVANSGPE